MPLINNSQSFHPSASGTAIAAMANEFQECMDSVLLGAGRNVTIHLPAGKSPCPSVTCVFDSVYKRYIGVNGILCEVCKGQGFIIEPRYTVYMANIRWANEPINQQSKSIEELYSPGRLTVNFARTKFVASAFDHVKESIGATIDGRNVELFQEPRQTGFGESILYTVCWWKAINL